MGDFLSLCHKRKEKKEKRPLHEERSTTSISGALGLIYLVGLFGGAVELSCVVDMVCIGELQEKKTGFVKNERFVKKRTKTGSEIISEGPEALDSMGSLVEL